MAFYNEIISTGGGNGLVLVDSSDTTADFLLNKLFAGSGITLTVLNPGGDESIQIASTRGGSGYQTPTSGVLGQNTFVWTTAPSSIVIDGATYQQTQLDGTVNWTGTTTTVLSIAPQYAVFAVE